MTETTSLRDRRRRQTERDIQRAALTLAVRHGYDALTTDQIATQAGISLRTFFNYYPNKDAALVGPVTPVSEESKQLFRQASGPLIDDLFEMLARQLSARPPDRDIVTLIGKLLAQSPQLLPVFHAPLERLHEDIVLLSAQRTGTPDLPVLHLLAHTLTHAISIAFRAWAADASITQDELLAHARGHVNRLTAMLQGQQTAPDPRPVDFYRETP